MGSGNVAVPAAANISGLTSGTAYHFRIRATNSVGTSFGTDNTFTTTSSPPPPPPTGWPDASNTGVPDGVTLTTYTGPCIITVPNTVIDAQTVNCDLDIQTTGVQITRSRVNGSVGIDVPNSVSITDSEILTGNRLATGIASGGFTALRVEVTGGNRGILCALNCTVQDSWIHGTYVESDWHASAVRAEVNSTIRHNTLACDWLIPTPLDGGCSADLTGYPDFAAPHDWTIDNNLFLANPTGAAFCAYGGSSPGKPYSNDPMTGVNIKFTNNVFQRGSNNGCGAYGPIDSFNPAATGAEWTNNTWDDGSILPTPTFP